jgi:predicted RND superfamily exporter protein
MHDGSETGRVARGYAWLVAHARVGGAAVVALTIALGIPALRVRPDYSLEQLFPVGDAARAAYDRYKRAFPGEDARAVVLVSAPDLFTRGGLEGLAALERDLRALPHVTHVLGPMSVDELVAGPFGPSRARLIAPDLPADELARRVARAEADPLLSWNVFTPGGRTVSILVDLDRAAAGSDAGRADFVRGAQALLARHARPGQELVLTGLPPLRARIAALIATDVARLVPLAVGLVLVLLLVAFRSAAAAAGGLAAILLTLAWTYGVLGALGWPLGMLMGILPVVLVIVSVADTFHVLSEVFAELRAGAPPRRAIAAAMAQTAGPCLVTELVLAAGFLTLLAIQIEAAIQFAIVTAAGMLLAWLANALALPLVLVALLQRPPRTAPAAPAAAARAVGWTTRVALAHPGRVVAVAAAVLAAAAAAATRVEVRYHVFDDLRPGSTLAREIAASEAAHGGLVPVAIHVEAEDGAPAPALDPAAIRTAERAAAFLRSFPEIRQANSLADVLRPLHRALAGDDPDGGGLPEDRDGVAQELATLGDRRLTAELVSADARSLAAVGRAFDAGSVRVEEIFHAVDAWVSREQAALDAAPGGPRLRLSATGQLRLFQDVNAMLVGGLAASFLGAILVSLLIMSIALRSLRLGFVALVPNVAPVLLVLAFMGAAGIPLQPVTVMAFSITLVIADDDTIQILTRFRAHHAAAAMLPPREAHLAATRAALAEAGVPMVLSGVAVSAGFLLLLLSGFLGPARLGALIGVTLLAAVAADLFLTPVLLTRLLPLRGSGGARQSPAEPHADPGALPR